LLCTCILLYNINLIFVGNKSESKGGSKEEIQDPSLVRFEHTGAIPKTKSYRDGNIYFIPKYFNLPLWLQIYYCFKCLKLCFWF